MTSALCRLTEYVCKHLLEICQYLVPIKYERTNEWMNEWMNEWHFRPLWFKWTSAHFHIIFIAHVTSNKAAYYRCNKKKRNRNTQLNPHRAVGLNCRKVILWIVHGMLGKLSSISPRLTRLLDHVATYGKRHSKEHNTGYEESSSVILG